MERREISLPWVEGPGPHSDLPNGEEEANEAPLSEGMRTVEEAKKREVSGFPPHYSP